MLRRLLLPMAIMLPAAALSGFDGALPNWLTLTAQALLAMAAALLFVRLLDIFVWRGWMARTRQGPPPRLLTDLFAALVMLTAAVTVAGTILKVPVTSLVTTSSVFVAVIGFALRDMLASLFAGLALNIEHPFSIGDWIALEQGEGAELVGQVVEVSWLTTQIRTKDHVFVVIPNAELATRRFKNYGHKGQVFRAQFEIVLDHALADERIERVLLTAAQSVPSANATARKPDIKIGRFTDRGVCWLVRFWLDDFDRLIEIQYEVQRAVLRHLHLAGISQPYRIIDAYQAQMPERHLELSLHRDRVISRAELFRTLDSEDVHTLSKAAIEHRIDAGTILVDEGDEGRSLFILLEGYLDISIRDGNGSRLIVNHLSAGAFFGEFSLLTGAPRSARVQAKTDCVLVEITSDAITPVLQTNPTLADHLAAVLAARQKLTDELRAGEPAVNQAQDHHQAQLLSRIRTLFGL